MIRIGQCSGDGEPSAPHDPRPRSAKRTAAGGITRNPATLAKAPRPDEIEVEPYTVDEVRQLLKAAGERRNSARWAIALALGLRQGEALGLRWSDVDLDDGHARGSAAVGCARATRHGCGGTCGEDGGLLPSAGPRPGRDRRHQVHAPDVVPSDCPPSSWRCSCTHREEQDRERAAAGQLWRDSGYVFATPVGEPINPQHRLSPLEAAACRCRAAGRSPPRCPPHGRDGAADPRRLGARGDGDHGLVDDGDGCPVPARRRASSGATSRSEWAA